MPSDGLIKTDVMKPFVATIPQGSNPKLDYDKLKAAKVSAMMFFGGELYDMAHLKRTYVNTHLASQVKQCSSSGLPYAIYVNVRAKTVIEADAECRALYYVLAEYPPTLGIWLSLCLSATTEVNNDIVEVYYKYIEKWGLKARCGFYVTSAQLSKVTWNKFQDRFYLWLIDDSIDIKTIQDKLLQPDLFEVPD